jgi:hypothetical protein
MEAEDQPFSTNPSTSSVSTAAVDPVYPAPADEPSIEDRLTKLETLAALHFGTEHFALPVPVFDPNAEAEAARQRFMRDMQEIEAKAKTAPKPN